MTSENKCFGFSAEEKEKMRAVKWVGDTVISRLEQISQMLKLSVIPAKAGIQLIEQFTRSVTTGFVATRFMSCWIPAFAGMTKVY